MLPHQLIFKIVTPLLVNDSRILSPQEQLYRCCCANRMISSSLSRVSQTTPNRRMPSRSSWLVSKLLDHVRLDSLFVCLLTTLPQPNAHGDAHLLLLLAGSGANRHAHAKVVGQDTANIGRHHQSKEQNALSDQHPGLWLVCSSAWAGSTNDLASNAVLQCLTTAVPNESRYTHDNIRKDSMSDHRLELLTHHRAVLLRLEQAGSADLHDGLADAARDGGHGGDQA